MAEQKPICFKASSFLQNDQNPSEKAAMEAKSKKAKLSGESSDDGCQEDRLSSLPDGILCHILSFLPTKFAASTSILSTRWRYIFIGVPRIDLDDTLLIHPHQQGAGNNFNDEKEVESEKKFMDFVNRLLMNCESTSVLSEFCLRCRKSASCHKFGLSLWMSLLLPRNVQVLDISIGGYVGFPPGAFEFFPSEIFTCKTLVVLKLNGWLCLKVPKDLCLPNLKVLYLTNLTLLGDNTGWPLSSSCPLLDDLRIDIVELWDVGLIDFNSPSLTRLAWDQGSSDSKVVLNTPNLEYLEYAGDLYPLISSSCKFKSLLKANLTLENVGTPHKHEANQFCQFISEMCNLEFLCLFGYSLKCLYQADRLLPEFINLTHLELSTRWVRYWKYIETLLKSTPNLKMLVCNLGPVEMGNDMRLCFSTKQKPLCLDQHLREVEIKNFSGIRNHEFDLVKYLLKHGAVLRKMSIYADTRKMPENWPLSVRKKLNKFPKRSKNCM